jgi:hypothetical protein
MNLVTLRIIWGALLGSHFLYGLGLYVIIKQSEGPIDEMSPVLLPIVSSIGMVIFFAAIYLPKFFLKNEKKQIPSNSKLEDLIPKFIAPFVIRLALFEAVALLGFGLAFLSKDMQFYYPFAAVSLVAYILNFPTEEKIKKAFN